MQYVLNKAAHSYFMRLNFFISQRKIYGIGENVHESGKWNIFIVDLSLYMWARFSFPYFNMGVPGCYKYQTINDINISTLDLNLTICR